MAGAAYLRARTLLREQAVVQFQNLMETQVRVIDGEVKNKNNQLNHLLESSSFKILVELGLHANPQRKDEFKKIRESLLNELNNLNASSEIPMSKR